MGNLEEYEVAVLLQMYDKWIVGKENYISIEKTSNKIKWQEIARAYRVKKKFKSVAHGLVNKLLLSDDGKSLKVLYLDKLGVDYVEMWLKLHPGAMKNLESKLK
jgi:hypothetical protein